MGTQSHYLLGCILTNEVELFPYSALVIAFCGLERVRGMRAQKKNPKQFLCVVLNHGQIYGPIRAPFLVTVPLQIQIVPWISWTPQLRQAAQWARKAWQCSC